MIDDEIKWYVKHIGQLIKSRRTSALKAIDYIIEQDEKIQELSKITSDRLYNYKESHGMTIESHNKFREVVKLMQMIEQGKEV